MFGWIRMRLVLAMLMLPCFAVIHTQAVSRLLVLLQHECVALAVAVIGVYEWYMT